MGTEKPAPEREERDTSARTLDMAPEDRVRTLLGRAHAGDPTVVPQLRALLDARPELWRQHGDLAQHVRTALLDFAAGKSLWAREAFERKMNELTAELAGESPSALEKILIERIVVCWAQSYLADLDAIQMDKSRSPQAGHYQKRQSAAHGRFLAAVRQLAVVRKLMVRAPSPLEMLGRPVPERAEPAVVKRRRAGLKADVGVVN